MSFSPSAAAANIANQIAANLAAAGASAMQTSIAGGNTGPGALVDGLLSGVGYQTLNRLTLGTSSYNGLTMADVAGTTWTFNAAVAKTYVVHCDFGFFANASGGAAIQLIVNGSAGRLMNVYLPTANFIIPFHLMHAAQLVQGANTIKLQWEAVSAITLQTNLNSYADYIVQG